MELSNPFIRLQYFKRRYQRAYSTTLLWRGLLESAQHYCIPNRNLFYYTNQVQGAQKNGKVYDTTPVAATRKFVAKIHSALTPPQQVWAKLEAGTDFNEEDTEKVNAYLEKTNKIVFDYLRHSNFDLVINECYYDLAVGTFVLVVNEGTDENPLQFHSIPLAQMSFEESINGHLDSCYRTWGEVKISEVQNMWPLAVLPSWMLIAVKNDPNALVKQLYEGVVYMPREEPEFPYRYVLWTDEHILLEDSYKKSPWIAARWSKINNEIMGRGPIIDALPSILSLNEVARLEFISANLNICKPYMAFSDSVFNPWTFRLAPNTVIPIAPVSNGQYPLQPLPDVANPSFAQVTAMDLRGQVNALLFANPIGELDDLPVKTATEIAVRQRNLAEEIGPSFTRLQHEYLSRVLQRVIDILQMKGLAEKLEINGKLIQARYQSPLVVAQGQQDVDNLMGYVQVMQSFYGEEGARVLNPITIPGYIATKMGVDSSVILSKEQLIESFQAQSDQQEQMMAAEMQNAA